MGNYAGVDWAADKHDVLVSDGAGEELLSAAFAHDEHGLRVLCRTLVRLKVQLVAIERPDGLLVERMLDAGLRVLPMHPKQVAAARARFRAAGGKSDRFDAFVLCELARTDNHRFRVLEPDSDETKALRALTRAREDLVHARVALCSQLRAELERFWPGPIGLFQKLDSPISLAFLERYPSPADARGLGEQRLAAFLARQRYSGGQQPSKLLAKLRRAPEGRVGEAEMAARRALVLALVATIKPLVEQIKQLTEQIATALRDHPDGEIFLSLFRDPRSVVTAAELLAEIGDCRTRYPTRDTLAADAGQAAVAVESGKRKTASFRWGCNKRLRGAFCMLADSTRHWHPWAADRYAAARARGHDHPRALRTLGRAWCRIVWRCWQDRTPYDPARHRACSSTARSPSPGPHHRAPCPTSPPPSGCSAPPSPTRRPKGPSAKRLTASRHPLSPPGEVDTGRLLS
jgi:transposase